MGVTADAAPDARRKLRPRRIARWNGAPLRGAGLPRPPFATFLGSPTAAAADIHFAADAVAGTPATPSRPSNT